MTDRYDCGQNGPCEAIHGHCARHPAPADKRPSIVERLRAYRTTGVPAAHPCICDEAANRIEQLRTVLAPFVNADWSVRKSIESGAARPITIDQITHARKVYGETS